MATSGRTGRTEREVETQPSTSRSTLAHGLSVAKPLAPEDIRGGDYVAVLDEMYEIPSYCWREDTALHPRDELVRIRLIPAQDTPPHKVKSVCLPFVLAKHPTGERRTFDLRRTRLARLDKGYGAAAWKAYRKKAESTPRQKKTGDAAL